MYLHCLQNVIVSGHSVPNLGNTLNRECHCMLYVKYDISQGYPVLMDKPLISMDEAAKWND